MEKMVAFCRIVCSGCPVYLATINDDDNARKKVAELWSKRFGFDMKSQDAYCDGCQSKDGRLFSHAGHATSGSAVWTNSLITVLPVPSMPARSFRISILLVPYAGKTLDKLRVKEQS